MTGVLYNQLVLQPSSRICIVLQYAVLEANAEINRTGQKCAPHTL